MIDNVKEALSVLKLYRNDWSLGSQNNERLNKAIDTVVEALEKPLPCERCKKLEYMIENGLGWKDVENDISPMHEL